MINWHWLYRDFINAYMKSPGNWLDNYKEFYLKPNIAELQTLHFVPKGYPNEANDTSRTKELGKKHYEDMVVEIQSTVDFERRIVEMAEDVLNILSEEPANQDVYVIVGLDCTNIYSVKYKNKVVTVICLESVKGNLDGLKLLLSHECHHWVRQMSFKYDLFESSIGERIITEGLASAFSEEFFPGLDISEYCYVPTSTVEWTRENLLCIDNLVSSQLDKDTLTSGLFSRNPSEQPMEGMPKRVGYVYGYLKVKKYKEKVQKSCVELKNIRWQDILCCGAKGEEVDE